MSERLNIGALRDLMLIQRPVETRGSAAEYTKTWVDVGTEWAEVLPVSASSTWKYSSLGATVSHRIRMWYRADVLMNCRLIAEDGRTFYIQSIVPMGDGPSWMEMTAEMKHG